MKIPPLWVICPRLFRHFLYVSKLSGCHFGRHLGFWRKLQGDSWELLVCYFAHIPPHVLKISACYEIFPRYNQYTWTTPLCPWCTLRHP